MAIKQVPDLQTTVIVPTFNEAENLQKIVAALQGLPLSELNILIVDDNSPDGTGQMAENLAAQPGSRVKVVHRTGKLGLGTAYLQGFHVALEAGAQAIAQMDADFSHPPEKLVEMHAVLDSCDVVIGSRYIDGGRLDDQWPLWRKGLSGFGNMYARTILGLPMHDVTGGFRLWRRETLAGMPLERVRSNGYIFQVELAYLANRLGYRSREIPIYFAERRLGTSKMSLRIQLEAALRVWQIRRAYQDL
ncbi:MAG: polyprenol monophosphomannose synthase [Anaerolineaceae bacterium]|nr:polyprenol monophosphomannose synthase [Anaerolineaceae bacterium]